MKGKYVLDSSIWVEIERENASVLDRVQPLIDKNEVCLVDVIVAELLRGAKTPRDYKRLDQVFSDFLQLKTEWSRVADLAFQVSRKGFHPPLVDLYIAQCVLENKKALITQDKHFRQIANVRAFELVVLSKPQNSAVMGEQ